MKFSAIFMVAMCIATSSLYSGRENSIASTSSSAMSSLLSPAILPFVVSTHITVACEALSNSINDNDKTIIDTALDELGLHAMRILSTELENANELALQENILGPTSNYLAQFSEQEYDCHLDQLKKSADLINTTLQSPIRGVSDGDKTSLREAINSLTSLSQNLLQFQQESTTEQRDQLRNHMLLVIQKTMECCK